MSFLEECRHCGHAWCYHTFSKEHVLNSLAMGFKHADAFCRGLFVRGRGIRRQPCDNGYSCICPGFEPVLEEVPLL